MAPSRSTVTNTRPPPYLAAFSTRLPSISSRSWRSTRTSRLLVAGDVDRDALVHPVDRALDRLEAFPHHRPGLGRGAAADRPGASEVVVDLAAHHGRLAADGVVQIGGAGGRGVGDDGQRGLERMGEVAGVAPGLFGLRFAMGEKLVDLLGQRADLGRKSSADARLRARPDRGHLAPDPAQRPQAVDRLQCGEHDQPEPEHGEAPGQRRAQLADLLVDGLARLARPGSAS